MKVKVSYEAIPLPFHELSDHSFVNKPTMAFQVRIRINKNTIKVLSVASSNEEFEKFTIGDLKRKAFSLFPGVNDPNRLRVIYYLNELEDDQTFESCDIGRLSVLIIVLLMPVGGGDTPKPGGNESWGKASETMGILGLLKIGSSFFQRSAEEGKIQGESVPQYTGATKPRPASDQSPSVQPDADLQFLQSLLPALKRMDLRRREFTKAAIQQLVFEIEFSERPDIRTMGAEAVQRLRTSVWVQDGGRASPAFSYLSMKSDASIPLPPDFSAGPVPDHRSSCASTVCSAVSEERIPH